MKVYAGGKELSRLSHISACILLAVGCGAAATGLNELTNARDRQDLNAVNQIIKNYQQTANTADGQYRLALAYSYAAEIAMEVRDKRKAEDFAEAGLDQAKKAIAANDNNAEYHRLLGELCGQVIPANPLMGTLKYGQCARDEIEKAIQLDPKLALAYVSRGVGKYYLPAQMGGGPEIAIKDFDKAIALDPKLADAYLWKGVALRKMSKDPEARQALQRAQQLDPNRLWVKEQLEKTPAQ
jgi:tetratricopeptide (TPR) repeat protein